MNEAEALAHLGNWSADLLTEKNMFGQTKHIGSMATSQMK